MSTLIIVRHGNTFDAGDTITRVGARTDLPLATSGIQQAEALAAQFKETQFSAAFCSPLLRTRQTARAILDAQFAPPPLLIAPFLTEIDYGPDENLPEAAVIARIGQDAITAWDQSATVPPGWSVDPGALIAAWTALFKRAAALPQDAAALVVTSNGIARFVLDAVDTLPDGTERKLKTGAWGNVTLNSDGKASLIAWNQRP
jgi:probable phosphoglycerate mutase